MSVLGGDPLNAAPCLSAKMTHISFCFWGFKFTWLVSLPVTVWWCKWFVGASSWGLIFSLLLIINVRWLMFSPGWGLLTHSSELVAATVVCLPISAVLSGVTLFSWVEISSTPSEILYNTEIMMKKVHYCSWLSCHLATICLGWQIHNYVLLMLFYWAADLSTCHDKQ